MALRSMFKVTARCPGDSTLFGTFNVIAISALGAITQVQHDLNKYPKRERPVVTEVVCLATESKR